MDLEWMMTELVLVLGLGYVRKIGKLLLVEYLEMMADKMFNHRRI
jgi:hypothetical protein